VRDQRQLRFTVPRERDYAADHGIGTPLSKFPFEVLVAAMVPGPRGFGLFRESVGKVRRPRRARRVAT
jgi:hypothetical protein